MPRVRRLRCDNLLWLRGNALARISPDTGGNQLKDTDFAAREVAREGLRQIEDAILRLLEDNPNGLRNLDIANLLSLRSDFRGGRRNYLTYSVLGGLLADGRVEWDQDTKIFTKANTSGTEQEVAQDGLRQIEDAILQLLEQRPQGLRNFEIAELLGLISDFRGGQRNYLTYSVLGGLLASEKVEWNQETNLFTKK